MFVSVVLLCIVPQPLHTEGLAPDRPVLPPPEGLPSDWVGGVGSLLQNLYRPRVSQRKSHQEQTGDPVSRWRGGGVLSAGGVGVLWTSRQRRAALRYVSSSWWQGERETGRKQRGGELKLFEFEWRCRCGIRSLALDRHSCFTGIQLHVSLW